LIKGLQYLEALLIFSLGVPPMMRFSLSVLLLATCAHGDPCDCILGPWTYSLDKVTYQGGCSATSDWPDQPWCYVKDKVNCIHGQTSTIPGETRAYKKCGPCNCRGAWDFADAGDGTTVNNYEGCRNDASWKPWCQVQGSRANCGLTAMSNNAGEGDWRACDQCGCMNSFRYNNSMHMGCFDDKTWGANWCYVDGGSNCATATASSVPGEARHYVKCGPDSAATKCSVAKKAYKDSHCCGNPDGAFAM